MMNKTLITIATLALAAVSSQAEEKLLGIVTFERNGIVYQDCKVEFSFADGLIRARETWIQTSTDGMLSATDTDTSKCHLLDVEGMPTDILLS